jgi:hypothetical protein
VPPEVPIPPLVAPGLAAEPPLVEPPLVDPALVEPPLVPAWATIRQPAKAARPIPFDARAEASTCTAAG